MEYLHYNTQNSGLYKSKVAVSELSLDRAAQVWFNADHTEIYGTFVGHEESLHLSKLVCIAGGKDNRDLSVTRVGVNFFVCWTGREVSEAKIFGVYCDPDLSPIGNIFVVSKEVTVGSNIHAHKSKCIEVSNTSVLVIWYDVFASGGQPSVIQHQVIDLETHNRGSLHRQQSQHANRNSHDPSILRHQSGAFTVLWEIGDSLGLQKLDQAGDPAAGPEYYTFPNKRVRDVASILDADENLVVAYIFGSRPDVKIGLSRFSSSDLKPIADHSPIGVGNAFKTIEASTDINRHFLALNLTLKDGNYDALTTILWDLKNSEVRKTISGAHNFISLE